MISKLCKYSIKNISRNKFLTISSVLVLTILMFFINILVLLEDVSSNIIKSVNSKMNISLYLKDEYTDASLEVKDLMNDVKNFQSGIHIQYKTKEALLEEFREKDPKLVQILERDNPIPNTIIISEVQLSDYEKLNTIIENKMFIIAKDKSNEDYFANYSSQYKRIQQVTFILDLLKKALWWIIGIFFVSIAVIMYSVISNFIYYYRDEIYITKLVWWANAFIYGPFVIQGILYATFAFLLNVTIFMLALKYLGVVLSEYYIPSIENMIFVAEFIIFVCIGGISWYISSVKYLKKDIK